VTPKQRQLATIGREPTDRISLDAICIENTAQVAELLGCADNEVHDRLGIDGRVVAAGFAGEAPVGANGQPLLRDEVMHCIDVLGNGGGYICGPDHHIKPDVSAQNTVELFHTAINYTSKGQ
jgi:hypothetical protein